MSDVTREAQRLRGWLFDAVLPLWWGQGADHVRGGFHEKIAPDGTPLDMPRRLRVAARQAHAYSEAGRMGWPGPWAAASAWALDELRLHFIADDGTVISLASPGGDVLDPRFDLYNQAFALLAFAAGERGDVGSGKWRTLAGRLRNRLDEAYAHSEAGYLESREAAVPLRSNPHMHLLEAAMVWMEIDPDPVWRRMADEIATLALERFIDSKSGALREFFAIDWSPAPGIEGRIAEPGHQYEWAYLLNRWAMLTGRALPDAVGRLIAFADAYGIDHTRGVAVNAVLTDGSAHDGNARLWPQTERIRAYCGDRNAIDDGRMDWAVAGLVKYFESPRPGLWFDTLGLDNKMVVEPSPASSLYHIVGAVAELSEVMSRIGEIDLAEA